MNKFDVNCCETVSFRPNLSEKVLLIYKNYLVMIVKSTKKYCSSQNTNTINGTVLIVAVSEALTKEGN